MSSENLIGADNQQERLDAYLAGFVDGEGSFHVALQRNPTCKMRLQLVPEFHVSQNVERRQVLDLLAGRFGCGVIRENHKGSPRDRSLVYVVRRRSDLIGRVIPFFEMEPLLSSKQVDFVTFARIVRAMERGEHLQRDGFLALACLATSMNGAGRYRQAWTSIEVSRILRDHMPNTVENSEDMVRSAWRHAESGRNDLIPDPDA